jgi:hypothetical protein
MATLIMADSSILGSHLLSGIDDAEGNWPKIEFSSLLIVADLENLARTEAVSLVQDGEMVDPHGRKSHTDRRRLVLDTVEHAVAWLAVSACAADLLSVLFYLVPSLNPRTS